MDSIMLEFHFDGEADPELLVARPLFLTVDPLTAQLSSITGIDTITSAYDPDLRVLTYHFEHTFATVSKVVETDFGDLLRAETGVFGLGPTGSDQITVEVSGIGLDVTFGVILAHRHT